MSKISFWHLLGLLFIYLSLTGQIDWHWFVVLSPIIFVYLRNGLVWFINLGKEEER